MKTRISIIVAALFAAFLSTSYAGAPGVGYGGGWPPTFPTRINGLSEATQYAKVALACKDCKTVIEKTGKRGIASLFKAPSTHGCSGCGGKISVTQYGGGKGRSAEYKHTCSKCGANSAFTCAGHKS